ncbi:MAG: Na+/H+ antiporter subunit E [Lachnospiraceae bacterium]|nr:Na+/H+ antiporter subunit E [Lachnospiraceae bacterium]
MFLLFFLLWVIFNGNFTLEIAVFGVVIAAAVFAFTCKFADYSIEKEKMLFRSLFRILRYVVVLVIEIVKANFAVVRLILSEEEEAEPALVSFRADLKTAAGRSALANAITLTPGTITVLLEDNVYTVHCLDETLAEGINGSVFEEMIKEIEKGGH